MAIYVLGGIYLLFLVYQMYEGQAYAGDDGILMIIFMGVFTIAGGAMVALGIIGGRKLAKQQESFTKNIREENEKIEENENQELK